ncbi:MAG: DUF4159 domain-containing protein [Geminicoccaceae bacterium]|nr:DUF4159 domain-containing protein [Geminicoccaceae bacterium]
MLTLGPLAFVNPWLLAALAGLPALWWLLRLTPPAPKTVAFPPLRLLLELVSREETPARTPLWLLILRIVLAALVIAAMARPILDPAPSLDGQGPVLIVIDDGWASARDWERRLDMLESVLAQAEREKREIVLVRSAPGDNGVTAERLDALSARESLAGLEPRPWPVDRMAVLDRIDELGLDEASTFWLSDGLVAGEESAGPALRLAERLRQTGPLTVVSPTAIHRPLLLTPPEPDDAGFTVTVRRSSTDGDRPVNLRASGPDGEILARLDGAFADGEDVLRMNIDLPGDLLARMARMDVIGEDSAGGTVLFDERWRRRSVGVAGTPQGAAAQPLLAESYYVTRALSPFATVREGSIDALLDQPISLLVLTDSRQVDEAARQKIVPWMEAGGIVLRFAGPRLADGSDDFLPVPLRRGDRSLGGALSWSRPLALAPIPAESPLAGIEVNNEARVSRQVLAQPSPELARATLASLEDGTPLITGRREGLGWLILVHTTANTAWSSLPLSGVFIDILRRILQMAPGAGGLQSGVLRIDRELDAFGRLTEASADRRHVEGRVFAEQVAGPQTPPGLWAPADSLEQSSELARVALNLQTAVDDVTALDLRDQASSYRDYERARERELLPWLLTVALVLALVDLLVSYVFRGVLAIPASWRRAATPVLVAGFALAGAVQPAPVMAQEAAQDGLDEAGLTATTRLAYVRTGLREVDRLSEAGLYGLGAVLAQRTTIETGEPVAVDLYGDDLNLFPLLYWPVPPDHPRIPEEAVSRLESYLRQGGLVLIDTGDAARLLPGSDIAGAGERRLQTILRDLDIPPLRQVPQDHVLTRSFYLLQDFPGRHAGGAVWVDQTPSGINDGVASMIIGSNDWAGAWAIDDLGRPLLPVVPGGERQREMARRFGVNLVMYALTGNYKTDQVHVPALLERLGQ